MNWERSWKSNATLRKQQAALYCSRALLFCLPLDLLLVCSSSNAKQKDTQTHMKRIFLSFLFFLSTLVIFLLRNRGEETSIATHQDHVNNLLYPNSKVVIVMTQLSLPTLSISIKSIVLGWKPLQWEGSTFFFRDMTVSFLYLKMYISKYLFSFSRPSFSFFSHHFYRFMCVCAKGRVLYLCIWKWMYTDVG